MASRFPQGQSQSAKYLALASLLDRLVDGTESRIDELIARFIAESLLTSFQKEAVAANRDTKLKTREVFKCVLGAVARNDSLFDRLIPILQELGYGHLADELLRAALPTSLSGPPGYQRSRPGAAVPGPTSRGEDSSHSNTRTENAYHGPELDSGIATRNPTGRHEAIDDDDDVTVPDQMLDRLHFSRSNSSSRFSTEEHSGSGAGEHEASMNENQNQYSHTTNDPSTLPPITTNSTSNAALLQPRLDLHEPQMVQELHEPVVDLHNEEQVEAPTPIQAAGDGIPNDVIVLPNGERFMSETMASSGTTLEEGLILSLADRIHHLRQELQQKDAEGMQKDAENLELQENCRKLEEDLQFTSNKLREQKQETKRIEEEKNAEIKDWKQRYEDKENEVKCLTEQIARIEKEKEEMTIQHKAEITELNAKHRQAEEKTEQKVVEYQTKITTLEKNLEKANQKKEKAEIALAQAEVKIATLKLQKEKELSNMKDQRHALQLKIRDLKEEVLKKELLLHSKDKELAEERHAQERRHSLALQQQVDNLQREIQRLRSQSSNSSTNSQTQDTE